MSATWNLKTMISKFGISCFQGPIVILDFRGCTYWLGMMIQIKKTCCWFLAKIPGITWCSWKLGGGFNCFYLFTPNLGEDEPNLTCAYFSAGVGSTQPPTRKSLIWFVGPHPQRCARVLSIKRPSIHEELPVAVYRTSATRFPHVGLSKGNRLQ